MNAENVFGVTSETPASKWFDELETDHQEAMVKWLNVNPNWLSDGELNALYDEQPNIITCEGCGVVDVDTPSIKDWGSFQGCQPIHDIQPWVSAHHAYDTPPSQDLCEECRK